MSQESILRTLNSGFPTQTRPRSTMDSIRASEAPDAGSIPAEATNAIFRRSAYTAMLPETTCIVVVVCC
jgi:hypothetical protein